MVTKVFTVYDSKVGAYARPFFMNTVPEAIRGWIDVVNDPKTHFNAHPEDYTLFEIAEYDDTTGKFENLSTPKSHGVALEFHEASKRAHKSALEVAK